MIICKLLSSSPLIIHASCSHAKAFSNHNNPKAVNSLALLTCMEVLSKWALMLMIYENLCCNNYYVLPPPHHSQLLTFVLLAHSSLPVVYQCNYQIISGVLTMSYTLAEISICWNMNIKIVLCNITNFWQTFT